MYNIKIADMHCDTLTAAYGTGKSLINNDIDTDISEMIKYNNYLQNYAVYISEKDNEYPLKKCLEVIDFGIDEIKRNNDKINLCLTGHDVYNAWNENKVAAVLSVEGGGYIDDISDLEMLYNKGVRIFSMTWNNDNKAASGAFGMNTGVTDFGKSLILEMNRLGMILDISHLSEKAFYDVCDITDKPIIATHSNAYEICENKRNIKKEQFLEIKRRGGVVGINFYPYFLNNTDKAEIEDVLKHIMFFLSLGGEDNICIGSDFDGICFKTNGLENCRDIAVLFECMRKKGISDDIIEKIAYKNVLRVLGICL